MTAVTHLWSLVQAIGLVYVVALGFVLLGAALALAARGASAVVSWITG